MLKKFSAILLCITLLISYLPVAAMAADVTAVLPIHNEMENVSGITGLDPSNTSLTQDRVSGSYAVKATYGDIPSLNYARYTLATSNTFDVKKYSQIKLWVKPGPGANWIKFYTNNNIITSDQNGDGIFKVGEDLVSGKWNAVTLDLSKLSISSGKDLMVDTNEYSNWTFDEVKSLYTPLNSVDVTLMGDDKTQSVNGQLQFKSNSGVFNITPTVLVSQNSMNTSQATFTRPSVAYKQDGSQVASGVPRYENDGIMVEEGTTNGIQNGNFATGDLNGWTVWGIAPGTSSITTYNNQKYAKIEHPSSTTIYSYGVQSTKNISLVNGDKGTLTFRVKGNRPNYAWIMQSTGNNVNISSLITYSSLENGEELGTYTWTAESPADVGFLFAYYGTGSLAGEFTAAQIEKKSYATSFTAGTRSAETLTAPTAGVLNSVEGTIECRVRFDNVDTTTYSPIFCTSNSAGPRLLIMRDKASKEIRVWDGDGTTESQIYSGVIPVKGQWYNIGFSWSPNGRKFYINGVLKSSNSRNEPIAIPNSTALLGQWGGNWLNGILKDITISNIARTDAQMQARGINTEPLPIDAHTTMKLNLNGSLNGETDQVAPAMPAGKITKINIDSGYVNPAGATVALPGKRVYLSGILPTVLGISGDGNKVYYANPSDGGKLYLLNLLTAENKKVADYLPTKIKVNYDGKKAVFVALASSRENLYAYDETTNTTTNLFNPSSSSYSLIDFDIQDDGTIYFLNKTPSNYTINRYNGTLSGIYTSDSEMKQLAVPKVGNKVFYIRNDSGTYKIYSMTLITGGWESKYLIDRSGSELLSNADGTALYVSSSGSYVLNVSSKALRNIELTGAALAFAGTNKIISQSKISDYLYNYKQYDIDSDVETDIKPSDAKNPSTTNGVTDVLFSVDNTGSKMAYTAGGGLATAYINDAQRPERYLLSFDGKNAWHTYKDGVWTRVTTAAAPSTSDLLTYGMTIDEVNGMTPADFEGLYADGREISQFDAAVYFASVDPYTSPSLKGIKVTLNGGQADGEPVLEKSLYTVKEQSFEAEKWRKIKKIYPVEIFPREAEARYLIVTDNKHVSYKNGQWVDVAPELFGDTENKWIEITQQGMTAEELRAIPESALEELLPANGLTVQYALKVGDMSTEGYTSQITVDYVENLFASQNLVLKITMTDGSVREYENLSKEQVEDFMQWLNERQYNRGPIFYTIKTGSEAPGVAATNKFVNYYMIVSVDVDEME